jgi:AraC-like DNA-binding protein
LKSYEAALSATFRPLRVEFSQSTRAFRSGLEIAELGGVRVVRAFSDPCHCIWDASPELTAHSDFFRLQIQEDGDTIYHSDGGDVHCRPHSVVLIRSGSERAVEQPTPARGTHVLIPEKLLSAHMRNADNSCFVVADGKQGPGRVLTDLIRSIWNQRTELRFRHELSVASSMIHLLRTVFDDRNESTEASISAIYHQRIERIIARHFADGDFSVGDAAHFLGKSTRYVQAILREHGTTFGALLLQQRLTATRDHLADPTMEQRSITEIAYACGFNDLSHFSRNFSRTFKMSPRSFRASVLYQENPSA